MAASLLGIVLVACWSSSPSMIDCARPGVDLRLRIAKNVTNDAPIVSSKHTPTPTPIHNDTSGVSLAVARGWTVGVVVTAVSIVAVSDTTGAKEFTVVTANVKDCDSALVVVVAAAVVTDVVNAGAVAVDNFVVVVRTDGFLRLARNDASMSSIGTSTRAITRSSMAIVCVALSEPTESPATRSGSIRMTPLAAGVFDTSLRRRAYAVALPRAPT